MKRDLSAWLMTVFGACGLTGLAVAQYGTTYNAKYVTPTVAVPLYGAGFSEGAAPSAAADDDRLKKIEEKLDRLIELLTKLADDQPQPQQQPGPPLLIRNLPQEDQTVVARKVERRQMPPPDTGLKLDDSQIKVVSDYFRGKKLADADVQVLSAAVGQTCTQCHAPNVDYKKKGGGFLLFDYQKDQK